MHAWEGIRVSQTCCLLVRWYSPRCWVDLHLVGIAPLITGISRVRVNLCLFEARGIQVTELHQPQRSLCGVCHARTIRVSFTITLYKPVKVDFHPANPYLFHTMRPLLNKDFRRLRWLLRQEPPKPVRGSSACPHTLFLVPTYHTHRLSGTTSRVSRQGRSKIQDPLGTEEVPEKNTVEDGTCNLRPLFRLKNALARSRRRKRDPS